MFDSTIIPDKSLIGRLIKVTFRLVPRSAVVPILTGPARGMKWRVGSSNHGCWLGMYERKKQRCLASVCKPGDVLYDVGANVGIYSLIGARCGAKVFAFEPVPENIRLLRSHVDLNRLSDVTIVPYALADECGTLSFQLNGSSEGKLDRSGGLTVQVTTLDEFCKSHPERSNL